MTSNYITYAVNLSKSQINKIKNAAENKCAISIRLTKKNLTCGAVGIHKLPLTKSQVKKLENAKTGVDLKLSVAQLKVIKTGGFLPLLSLIPLIAGAVGAAGGLAGGITTAVNSSRQTNEQARHNREMEEQNKATIEQLKSGTGVVSDTVSKVPILGPLLGPVLKKIGLGSKEINKLKRGICICKSGCNMQKIGDGLYLEPEGSGVFLGQRGE